MQSANTEATILKRDPGSSRKIDRLRLYKDELGAGPRVFVDHSWRPIRSN
jgi:hypothetical protein